VLGRILGEWPYWWLVCRLLSVDTTMGRKVKGVSLFRGAPLIGMKPRDIVNVGVTRLARM
jgi:hypothetical protein